MTQFSYADIVKLAGTDRVDHPTFSYPYHIRRRDPTPLEELDHRLKAFAARGRTA